MDKNYLKYPKFAEDLVRRGGGIRGNDNRIYKQCSDVFEALLKSGKMQRPWHEMEKAALKKVDANSINKYMEDFVQQLLIESMWLIAECYQNDSTEWNGVLSGTNAAKSLRATASRAIDLATEIETAGTGRFMLALNSWESARFSMMHHVRPSLIEELKLYAFKLREEANRLESVTLLLGQPNDSDFQKTKKILVVRRLARLLQQFFDGYLYSSLAVVAGIVYGEDIGTAYVREHLRQISKHDLLNMESNPLQRW